MENLKKKKLWLICGIPGLGKSTWSLNHKNFFEGRGDIVSRDIIRFSLLKEGENYFSHEKEVLTEYVESAKASLKCNDDTILDATHLNSPSRAKILRALKDNLKDVEINVIFFTGKTSTALERNANRIGLTFVPPEQIKAMAKKVELPFVEEGFDNIYIYNVDTKEMIKKEMI